MTIPENILKVRISGGWTPTTSSLEFLEEFNFGFHLLLDHTVGVPIDWQLYVDDAADNINSKFGAHFGEMQSLVSNHTVFNKVDVYHLDTDGLALHHGQSQINTPTGDRGTSTANPMPFEVATAVSLYAYSEGAVGADLRSRRGRFYLPGPSVGAADVDGRFTTTARDGILAFANAFLNDVQGMHVTETESDFWRVVVVSARRNAAYQVERIRVGRVPDSQRRRRRSLDEAYSEAALSHS